MDEGDPPAVEAGAGRFVNEADASPLEASQGGLDVVHGVGDVVRALAAFGQETADRAIGIDGLDQFDPPWASLEGDGDDTLRGNVMALAGAEAEGAVGRGGIVDVADDEADVMQAKRAHRSGEIGTTHRWRRS